CADDCAGDTDRDKQCRRPSPVTGDRPCVETVGKARVFVAQTSLDFPEPKAIVMTGLDHSLTSLGRFVGRRRRHPIGRVLRTVDETVLRTAAWPSDDPRHASRDREPGDAGTVDPTPRLRKRRLGAAARAMSFLEDGPLSSKTSLGTAFL